MRTVVLDAPNDLEAWRNAARQLLKAGVAPEAVFWTVGAGQETLFDRDSGAEDLAGPAAPIGAVPARFIAMAEDAICHSDPARFDLLYRLLWRLQRDKTVLSQAADREVIALEGLIKVVRRDSHKMTAFVRFRRAGLDHGRERFAAWFEPEHFIVERTAPFFARRFAGMDWAILTPYRSAFWDGAALSFGPGARREDVPADDALEDAWRTYFASIFNPARLKIRAMTAEMPKKYWRNLPEADLIVPMIRSAQESARDMIAKGASQPPSRHLRSKARAPEVEDPADGDARPSSLAQAREAVQLCRRCPLYEHATQGVFGEGPAGAQVMMVGEQPGDREDLSGRPFVGPAGQLLDGVLDQVGIDRTKVYVTNAVKHFKFTPRGKRRLHQSPNAGEISACRFWLELERDLVKPKIIVALGASAAKSLLGPRATISAFRDAPQTLDDGTEVYVTVHPSYLLRLPDREKAESERLAFARDLKRVLAAMEALAA